MKNNNNNKNGREKVVNFFKHNAYYLVMVLCLIAIITMVSVAVAGVNEKPTDQVKPDEPVITEPDVPTIKPVEPDVPVVEEPDMNFILPVQNAEIVGRYTEDNALSYNPVLDEYSFHTGVDFKTNGKAPVSAVLDGEVITAKKHKMYGYVVEIKHSKDIVTVYRSLDDLKVSAGDTVKKGDVIGFTSSSDISESNLKEHVHFEIKEAGVTVNPNKYLVYEEK